MGKLIRLVEVYLSEADVCGFGWSGNPGAMTTWAPSADRVLSRDDHFMVPDFQEGEEGLKEDIDGVGSGQPGSASATHYALEELPEE